MTRRDVLKQLALITGGMLLVPSCDFTPDDVMLAYDHLRITEDNKAILQKLCNVILPTDSDHPGAEELSLSDFVLVMLDDCYGPDDQEKFTNGLNRIDQYAYEQTRQNFLSLSQAHGEELIQSILDHPGVDEENENQDVQNFEDIRFFTHTTKNLAIQGYMASEYIMTQVMPYKLVPGPFQGKVPVVEHERINING